MATLRIRLSRFGGARGGLGGQLDVEGGEPLLSVTLSVGATATATASQPAVPSSAGGDVSAILVAVDAPVYVDLGAAPDPTAEPRHLVLPGIPMRVRAGPGDRIAAIVAGDVAVGGTGSVTAAGVGGAQAQAVQGIGGGVPVPVASAAYGVGDYQVMPAGSANGTPVSSVQAPLTGARAVRLLASPGQSFTYTVARAQPASPPIVQITVSCPVGASNPNSIDEDLAGSAMVYVLARTNDGQGGSPAFRYL